MALNVVVARRRAASYFQPMPAEDNRRIPGQVLHGFLRVSAALGLDPSRIFADAGLPTELGALANAHLSVEQFDALVEGLRSEADDPALGLHLGEMFNLFDLNILTTLINTSRTLGEGAAHFERFRGLFNPLLHASIERKPAESVVTYVRDPLQPLAAKPHYAEFVLSFHLAYARWLLREPIAPRRASFRHAAPSYAEEYERIFDCPVHFEAEIDAFFLDPSVLERPLQGAYAAFNRQAAELAAEHLARLPGADAVAPDVIRLIRDHLPDPDFDLDAAAKALGLSPRTLQRRLRDDGLSFTQLRDNVRSERALELMRDVRLSIDQVAERLGYAERSNFTHAFRRWTGVTPGVFRRQLAG